MEKFVLDSPALENAVKLRSTTNYPPRRPGRSSLKETPLSGGYDGFFAVQFDGETFSVVDGSDPDSSIAGYYYFNGQSRSAKKATGISPALGWLCLKDCSVSSGGVFEIYTGGIPSKPEKEDGDDYHPIAFITKKGETWSFRQVSKWEIPQLWTFEDCEDE